MAHTPVVIRSYILTHPQGYTRNSIGYKVFITLVYGIQIPQNRGQLGNYVTSQRLMVKT